MSPIQDVQHPGDLERHIMRELGFGVAEAGDEMHGSAHVVPEMWRRARMLSGHRSSQRAPTSSPGTSPSGS